MIHNRPVAGHPDPKQKAAMVRRFFGNIPRLGGIVTILSQKAPWAERAVSLTGVRVTKSSPDRHTKHDPTMQSIKSIQKAVLATSLLGCISANAANETTATGPTSSSSASGLLLGKLTGETDWDRAWSAFTLYKDENNPILQEFALQGRVQAQAAFGDSSSREYREAGKGEFWGSDIEARRARLGFKSKWFQNWKLEGQIDVDADFEDNAGDNTFYKDIYDLYLTYAPSDALNVSIGKTKVKFGREQEISSKEILTFERSVVSNQLFPGELTGAWVSGKGIGEHWLYELGVYGNDRVREFSNFDDGAIILAKIGYDYSSQSGLDSAVAGIHFMHNTQPDLPKVKTASWSGSATPPFTDSIALTNDIIQGRWGLTTDVLYGFGDGAQSDVFSISIIPSYFIADGLQLIGRVQLATSSDDGISVQPRYESTAGEALPDVKGNSYFSTYLGLNYYFYGHKLKLMNGVEYSQLGGGDYDGFTYLTGIRFNF
jgi:phosphate-selective porin OprO/OprP